MRIYFFTRSDEVAQRNITDKELLSFVHTDELNGEDSVEIKTTRILQAGDRLLWQDAQGILHEHVCQDPKGTHDGNAIFYTDIALNSICDLYGAYIDDKRPYSYTFEEALKVALKISDTFPTRWSVGTVTQTGTVSSGLTFYHTSARKALSAILACGGEMETEITQTGTKITTLDLTRKVNLLAQRGLSSSESTKRFVYGKDIKVISRTESWDVITACYGYGKGVETDSGAYGRKLTFSDINNGKAYVENSDARITYGWKKGSSFSAQSKYHIFGIYENSECEDAQQLLTETKAYLSKHSKPSVTYAVDAFDLTQIGRGWEHVGVGDYVQIIDPTFTPELRCWGRVTKLVTDMLAGTQEVTITTTD